MMILGTSFVQFSSILSNSSTLNVNPSSEYFNEFYSMDQISDKQEKSFEREDWESKRIVGIIEQSRTVEVKNLIDIFECPICMELLETVDVYGVAIRLPFCSHAHYFHTQCAKQMLMTSGKCAICSHLYIVKQGNQPLSGTMRVIRGPPSLAGYKELGIGTIIINYNFPNGVQTEIMPCPGQQYYGTNRTACDSEQQGCVYW